jgi:hypothetical protein
VELEKLAVSGAARGLCQEAEPGADTDGGREGGGRERGEVERGPKPGREWGESDVAQRPGTRGEIGGASREQPFMLGGRW